MERVEPEDHYGDNCHSSKEVMSSVAMFLAGIQRGRWFIIASDITQEHVTVTHSFP